MLKYTNMLIVSDSIAALISHYFGQYIRLGTLDQIQEIDGGFALRAAIYVLLVIISGFFCELYTADRHMSKTEIAARTSISITLAFFVLSIFSHIAPQMSLGRGVLSLSLLVFGVLHYLLHRVWQACFITEHLAQKIMVLGVGPLAEVIQRLIPNSSYNYRFSGFIQPNAGAVSVAPSLIVGQVDQIEEILTTKKINKLIVSISEKRGALPVRSLLNCKLRGVEIIDSPSFYEKLTGKLLIEDIQPSWFIYSSGFRITQFHRVWKRSLDIIFSLIGILLALPLLPIIVLLIKFTSVGPVLFRQKRVGEFGQEFMLYKFRTMKNDAEKETGAVWACENDPRITKLGHWLRKTRIDEIPQLFNVLNGNMSFIGPRPERKEFVERLTEKIPYYNERHFIKPGITGWAQVRYPYGASEEDALEKLRFDLYYIKNYSVTLDLIIILETVKVVLFGRGGR